MAGGDNLDDGSAVFYSSAGDTFATVPAPTGGMLSGTTNGATGASYQFLIDGGGFGAVSVFEAGGDSVNLTTPSTTGYSETFVGTPTVSTLTVSNPSSGVSNSIIINTYANSNGTLVPIASSITVTGNEGTSDTADIYDAPGSNSLVAQGNSATLTTPASTFSVSQFGSVNAFQTQGSDDTVHQQSLDYALQTVGNWTSD